MRRFDSDLRLQAFHNQYIVDVFAVKFYALIWPLWRRMKTDLRLTKLQATEVKAAISEVRVGPARARVYLQSCCSLTLGDVSAINDVFASCD